MPNKERELARVGSQLLAEHGDLPRPTTGQFERLPLAALDLQRELCDLLSLYPCSTPQQIINAVLFLRSDADARQFTIHCLLAERSTLLEAMREHGMTDVQGIPIDEIAEKGLRL